MAPYSCDFCGDICGDLRTICEHVLNKHGKQETKCRVCDETFVDDSQLQNHLFNIHGIEDEYVTEGSNGDSYADDGSDSLSHSSDVPFQNGAENIDSKNADNLLMDTVMSSKMDKQSSPSAAMGINTSGNVLHEQVIVNWVTKCKCHNLIGWFDNDQSGTIQMNEIDYISFVYQIRGNPLL